MKNKAEKIKAAKKHVVIAAFLLSTWGVIFTVWYITDNTNSDWVRILLRFGGLLIIGFLLSMLRMSKMVRLSVVDITKKDVVLNALMLIFVPITIAAVSAGIGDTTSSFQNLLLTCLIAIVVIYFGYTVIKAFLRDAGGDSNMLNDNDQKLNTL